MYVFVLFVHCKTRETLKFICSDLDKIETYMNPETRTRK